MERPKRFTYTLKALLVGVTLAGLLLAFYTSRVIRIRTHVRIIEQLDCQVLFESELLNQSSTARSRSVLFASPFDKPVRLRIGSDCSESEISNVLALARELGTIREVYAFSDHFGDDDAVKLVEIDTLTEAGVHSSKLTAVGARQILKSPSLHRINLAGSRNIWGAEFSSLVVGPNVRAINLENTGVDSVMVSALRRDNPTCEIRE